MRSYQTRVIPNAIAGVIIRKDHLDRDRQRIPCEDRGKNWSCAATAKAAWSHRELEEASRDQLLKS